MEQKTTVKDVLKDVLETLGKISVPMSMIDEIGMPIARAINGVKACVDAMDRADEENAAGDDQAGESDA